MPTFDPDPNRFKGPIRVSAAAARRQNFDATIGLLFHLLAVSIVMIGVLLAQAAAEEPSASALQACVEDYRRLCSTVAPGGGRTKQCMLDHADELSAACRTVLLQASGAQ